MISSHFGETTAQWGIIHLFNSTQLDFNSIHRVYGSVSYVNINQQQNNRRPNERQQQQKQWNGRNDREKKHMEELSREAIKFLVNN